MTNKGQRIYREVDMLGIGLFLCKTDQHKKTFLILQKNSCKNIKQHVKGNDKNQIKKNEKLRLGQEKTHSEHHRYMYMY